MPVIHIVISEKFRGMGYSKEALTMLCIKAKENGIKKIYNDIPKNRIAAIKTHKSIGFKELKGVGKYVFLVLETNNLKN